MIESNSDFTKIFNFDEEEKKISSCVVKIITEKLDIVDCFTLLEKNINCHIFDNLCLLLGLSVVEIDKLKISLDDKRHINDDFESNFTPEIINFVKSFNTLNTFKSLEYQISQTLIHMYYLIKDFIENHIFKKMYYIVKTLNDLKEEKNMIQIK